MAATGWMPLILTALGSGAISAVITTYGTQGRDRRTARVELMTALAHADRTAGRGDAKRSEILDAGRAVVTATLLAGIPPYVADTYLLAYSGVRHDALAWYLDQRSPRGAPTLGLHIYHEAMALITLVIAHPLQSRLVRRHRS
jgi:hypothetical protein